jgi:multidrug resistance efflux pump
LNIGVRFAGRGKFFRRFVLSVTADPAQEEAQAALSEADAGERARELHDEIEEIDAQLAALRERKREAVLELARLAVVRPYIGED